MCKQALIAIVMIGACVPADPGPTYYPPQQQQWGQQQPQPPPPQTQPQPEPYPQPQPQPYPQPPPPPQPDTWQFDARGWTLLGSATVDGRRDRDVISVARYQGRFDQLTMVVYDSDLSLDDLIITFGNKETYSPNTRHLFTQGSRSRAIDLPGDDRLIKRIELRYSNLAGGGRARVEIYGRDTGRTRPTTPPPPPAPDDWKFDARGWTLLGSETVDGKHDRDTVRVGKYQGRFDQLTMVVYDSDLTLDDLVVTFGNNETFAAGARFVFQQGSRSRAIDLPGDDRMIKRIDLRYSNLPGGGKARVEIYGRDTGKPRPPKPDAWKFDARGWTLLGSSSVDGKHDRDVIKVGKYQGRFDQLTLVVYDSDLSLDDLTVTFGNNETFAAGTRFLFKEGSRSRAIDLPGDDRMIKRVDLRYSNLAGGGKARVEIYGRDTGKPRPDAPKPDDWKFDARGWTLLGSQAVNGKHDRDTIKVGKYQGRFDQLTLVVYDSDLTLDDLVVTFGNNETFAPGTRHLFKEGSRSKAIDLPGDDRVIKRVELRYSNLPGGGKARAELYGRDTGKPRPTQPAPEPRPDPRPDPRFDPTGWTALGKTVADGKKDRDLIGVNDGVAYKQILIRVPDSELELKDVVVTFGNNETFSSGARLVFTEGTPTATIGLPGKVRKIKSVELVYGGAPKGGKATVEVYGKSNK